MSCSRALIILDPEETSLAYCLSYPCLFLLSPPLFRAQEHCGYLGKDAGTSCAFTSGRNREVFREAEHSSPGSEQGNAPAGEGQQGVGIPTHCTADPG